MTQQTNKVNKSLFKLLNTRPVAFNPLYSIICGTKKLSNLTKKTYLEKNQGAGILLSQLLYWYSAMQENEFYKEDSELIEECGCSEYAYKQAKKVLIEKKFISFTSKHPRNSKGEILNLKTISHWIINGDVILQEVLSSRLAGRLEFNSSCNDSVQDLQEGLSSTAPILTENTTENTTTNSTS
jgi:hypothetical protein